MIFKSWLIFEFVHSKIIQGNALFAKFSLLIIKNYKRY